MPSIGSMTKTVRFYADDLEKIEELVNNGATFSGAVHQLIENSGKTAGTPIERTEVMAGIEEMATLCGMTLDEFMGQIYSLLEEGKLLVDGDRIIVG